MVIARRKLIDHDALGYYHIFIRCVRRAYLCGEDEKSEKNYDHRKDWIKNRLKFLNKFMFVEVGTYAIMCNHMHLILKNRPDLAAMASDHEVARRHLSICRTKEAKNEKRWEPKEEEIKELIADKKKFKRIREEICSISILMKYLNQNIARRANIEDDCKGRFFESRFSSQYLADEKALLACSVYVDLNPIRAKMAKTPEESIHTGAYERLKRKRTKTCIEEINETKSKKGFLSNFQKKLLNVNLTDATMADWLGSFNSIKTRETDPRSTFYRITEDEYLDLIDYSGSRLQTSERDEVPAHITNILNQFKMKEENWFEVIENFGSLFYLFAGSVENINNHVIRKDKKWVAGVQNNERIFSPPKASC